MTSDSGKSDRFVFIQVSLQVNTKSENKYNN